MSTTVVAPLVVVAIVAVGHRMRPQPVRSPIGGSAAGGSGRSQRLERVERAVVDRIGLVRQRRRGITPGSVAEWCADLAREVRTGRTLRSALQHTAPVWPPLATATDPLRLALERGGGVEDAAARTRSSIDGVAAAERGAAHLVAATAVITACGRDGGAAAPALDRVAAAMRRRAADDQERRAQSAQARMSAHVLTVVPLAVLGLLSAVDPDVRRAVASPAGLVLVSVGLALNLIGWWWMGRIVDGGRS